MSLTLSAQELELLREALTLLASPLEVEDVDDWRSQVNRVVRELFQSDQALLLLPGCGAEPFHSNEYDPDTLQPYLEYYQSLDRGLRRVRAWDLDVFCRTQLFAEDRATLLRSECYNDFLVPNGMEDSLGMMAEPANPLSAGLWIHNNQFGRPNAGARGMRIARLLQPVFRVGSSLLQRLHPVRHRLGSLVDTLDEATLLLDSEGRVLHGNAAYRSLMADCPVPEKVRTRVRSAALAATTIDEAGHEDDARRLHQGFTAAGHRYEVKAIRLGMALARPRGDVLVVVRRSEVPPEPRRLRERFGLTKRQAEVAIHLWHGRTNKQIAEELFISPHTARHHTEHILSKLGIRSRNDVRSRVAEDGSRSR